MPKQAKSLHYSGFILIYVKKPVFSLQVSGYSGDAGDSLSDLNGNYWSSSANGRKAFSSSSCGFKVRGDYVYKCSF